MCSLAQGCPSPSLWPHRQGSFPLMLKPNQLRSGYRILTPPAMSEREQRANRYRQSMWMYCVWTHYGLCASECVRDFIHSKVTYHNLYTVTHSSSNAHRHTDTASHAEVQHISSSYLYWADHCALWEHVDTSPSSLIPAHIYLCLNTEDSGWLLLVWEYQYHSTLAGWLSACY